MIELIKDTDKAEHGAHTHLESSGRRITSLWPACFIQQHKLKQKKKKKKEVK
jgi:hypothetical protein